MNLELGEFVVMPNHIHGIICIGKNEFNHEPRRDAMHGVSTTTAQSEYKNQFAPHRKILHP
jgi:putative transposase